MIVQAILECASHLTTEDTLDCLRNVPSSQILNAIEASLALKNQQFPWCNSPTLLAFYLYILAALLTAQYVSSLFRLQELTTFSHLNYTPRY